MITDSNPYRINHDVYSNQMSRRIHWYELISLSIDSTDNRSKRELTPFFRKWPFPCHGRRKTESTIDQKLKVVCHSIGRIYNTNSPRCSGWSPTEWKTTHVCFEICVYREQSSERDQQKTNERCRVHSKRESIQKQISRRKTKCVKLVYWSIEWWS